MGKNKLLFFIGIVLAMFLYAGSSFLSNTNRSQPLPDTASQQQLPGTKDKFLYTGEDGENALVLLQKKTAVERDTSGLVVSINGRKANSEKREFWAFYVNGKMASVGPKEYVTKTADAIEWKIEAY